MTDVERRKGDRRANAPEQLTIEDCYRQVDKVARSVGRAIIVLGVVVTLGLAGGGWLLGRTNTVAGNADNAAKTAQETALLAGVLATENKSQDHEIAAQARRGCRRTNAIRLNQAEGIREQIRSAERSLAMNLGVLESFRAQIVEQNEERKKRLRRLRVDPEDSPEQGNPYVVDCVKAHPDP